MAKGPDLRHRHRRYRHDCRPHGALSEDADQRGLARAAKAVFCAGGRYLSSCQGVARDVHLLEPQRDPRPAFLTPRSDLLPQPADLSEARPSRAGLSVVPLCSEAGRLSLPRAFGEYCTVHRPFSSARQDEPCLPTPRSGRPTTSAVSAVSTARRAERDRLGYRPERGTEALRPAADSGRHHRGAFCAGLCHRRRIRPGALFLRWHRKIFAGCYRPTKPRYRRDGSPGIAAPSYAHCCIWPSKRADE